MLTQKGPEQMDAVSMLETSYLAKHNVHHAFRPILQLKAEHKPLLIGPGHFCFLTEPFYQCLGVSYDNVAIFHLQNMTIILLLVRAGANTSCVHNMHQDKLPVTRCTTGGFQPVGRAASSIRVVRLSTCISTADDGAW